MIRVCWGSRCAVGPHLIITSRLPHAATNPRAASSVETFLLARTSIRVVPLRPQYIWTKRPIEADKNKPKRGDQVPIGAHSLQVCIYINIYIYMFSICNQTISENYLKVQVIAQNLGSENSRDMSIFQGHLPPAVFLLMPQGQRRIRWDLVLFEEGESWLDLTIASHDHLKLLFTPLAPQSLFTRTSETDPGASSPSNIKCPQPIEKPLLLNIVICARDFAVRFSGSRFITTTFGNIPSGYD